MSIDPGTYPSRAFIRFMAQNQLRADLTGQSITTSIQRSGGESYLQQVTPNRSEAFTSETSEDAVLDEALFEEIAKTTFSASRYPELYQSCGTHRAAKAVETRVANELIDTYRQIKQKQNCALVERLNALL